MKKAGHHWKIGDRAPRIGDWVICIFDWNPFRRGAQGDIPYFKDSIGKVVGPLKHSRDPTMMRVKWFTDQGEVEWPTHIDRFKVIEFKENV